MNEDPSVKAICPLFNFQISEVLVGNYTHEETMGYFNALRKRLEQGIKILDDVRIRRIREEDFNRIKKSGFFPSRTEIFSRIGRRTFVIEVMQREFDAKKIELIIYKILLSLRLYKAQDVFCKVIWFEKKSKVNILTILDSPLPDLIGYDPYVIEIHEVGKIKKLAKRINKINFGRRNSLRIACERFSRSYEEHREDDEIIDFMIAFESLFLKGKTAPSNAGQFIGLGCSMLLGKNGKEREEINEFLVEAYKIRNKIVHGSEFITSIKIHRKTWKIEDFVSQLQKYLRESIMRLM